MIIDTCFPATVKTNYSSFKKAVVECCIPPDVAVIVNEVVFADVGVDAFEVEVLPTPPPQPTSKAPNNSDMVNSKRHQTRLDLFMNATPAGDPIIRSQNPYTGPLGCRLLAVVLVDTINVAVVPSRPGVTVGGENEQVMPADRLPQSRETVPSNAPYTGVMAKA